MERKSGSFSAAGGIISLLAALIAWLLIGPLAAGALLHAFPDGGNAAAYIALNIPYMLMMLSFALAFRLLGTGIPEAIAGKSRGFRAGYAAECAAIYLLAMIIISLLSLDTIAWNPVPVRNKLLFLLLVLLITPIQTTAEEILFRALPMRIAYGWKLPRTALESIPPVILTGLLFTFPHLLNPEVEAAGNALLPLLYYFLWGAAAAFLAIATDGFEAPVAMHAANNIYIAAAVNYTSSPLPTASFFIDSGNSADAASIACMLAIFLIIYLHSLRSGQVLPPFAFRKRADKRYNGIG